VPLEADVTQVATESLVEATAGYRDAAVVSSEKIPPLPPLAGRREVKVSAVAEGLVPVVSQVGGDAAETPTADATISTLLKLSTSTSPTCRTTTGTSSWPY
jgi:hypothetical protein